MFSIPKATQKSQHASLQQWRERVTLTSEFVVAGSISPFTLSLGGQPINRDSRGPDNRPRETRINERIRAREIRLIGDDNEMIGIMPPMRALDIAREKNLDLVEISPMAQPPVCKLMDYGRYKYEQAKKENEARKKQKVSEVKEIRVHPHTDVGDIKVRVKKIVQFLADGDKVKVSVQFRGREVFHPELGRGLLEDILNQLKGIALAERLPIMEGRNMWMMLTRAPGWDPTKPPPVAAQESPSVAEVAAPASPATPVAPASVAAPVTPVPQSSPVTSAPPSEPSTPPPPDEADSRPLPDDNA